MESPPLIYRIRKKQRNELVILNNKDGMDSNNSIDNNTAAKMRIWRIAENIHRKSMLPWIVT